MALVLATLLVGAASDESEWTHRSAFAGAVSAQFITSDDAVIVLETRLSRREVRFLSADGVVLQETTLTHRGRVMPYEFVLVDEWHIALPMLDPERVGLVPETSEPSPTAQRFLQWVEGAGGFVPRGPLRASTNAFADVSCAVGADGSIAVWRTRGPLQFVASAPNAVSVADDLLINGVYCLQAEERLYAAIHVIDSTQSVPNRSWLKVYGAGASSPMASLPLRLDDMTYLLDAQVAGADMLVAMSYARARPQEDWTWIATRVSFANGEWRIERARLTGEWPSGAFVAMRAHDVLLLPNDDGGAVRVAWPSGASTVPYSPEPFRGPEPEFHGPYSVSPSGARLLWTNHRDAIRVTRAPAG